MDKQQVLSALEGLGRGRSKSSKWIVDNYPRPKRPSLGDDVIVVLDRIKDSGYADQPAKGHEYIWTNGDVDDPDYFAHEEDEETGEEVYKPYQAVIDRIVADHQKEPLVVVAVVVNGREAGGLGGFIEQMPERAGVEFDIVQVERSEDDAGQPTAEIVQDITVAVEGRDVLLLQWVVGTGCTVDRVAAHLRERNPQAVRVGAVLDDVALRTASVTVDYRVAQLERQAVIGVARGQGFNFPGLVI